MEETRYISLITAAFEARRNAYAPYSKYKVGAAVITENNKIYRGCNIENASYGATNCAERTAIFKAVSEGERLIKAIAVVGGNENETEHLSDYAFPCGICRQVIREFSNPEEMIIIVAKSLDDYKCFTLEELLPNSFGPEKL